MPELRSHRGPRRIIPSNWLGPIGLGSKGEDGKSCTQNLSGTGDARREWTAWPPDGIVPVQALSPTYDVSIAGLDTPID